VAGSATDPFGSKNVSLTSEVFNHPVTLAILKQAEAAEQEKYASQEKASHFKVHYQNYTGLGNCRLLHDHGVVQHPGPPKGTTLPKGFSLPKLRLRLFGHRHAEQYPELLGRGQQHHDRPSKLAALVSLAMKL